LAELLGLAVCAWLVFMAACMLASDTVDTGYRDVVIKQYIEREQRGERQPVALHFSPRYLEQWKREKGQ